MTSGAVSRGLHWLLMANEILVVGAIVADLILTGMNVLLRGLFAHSIYWADDIFSILFSMIVFLGAAAAFRRKLDLRFTYFIENASEPLRGLLCSCGIWLLMGSAALVLLSFPPYFASIASHRMISLPVSEGWVAIWMGLGYAFLLLYAVDALLELEWVAIAAGLMVALLSVASLLALHFFGFDPLAISLLALAAAFATGVPIAVVVGVGGATFLYLLGLDVLISLPAAFTHGISSYVLHAVPFFLIAGVLMSATGLATRLVDMMAAWMGHWPAGLLINQIAAMYVVSGVSGSKTADLTAVGTVMSGPLRERGYPPSESVATLNAAGAMGETVPPSIGIVLLAGVTGLSVGALFLAGFIPALVLAVALVFGVLYRGRGGRFPPGSHFDAMMALRKSVHALPALGLPFILIAGIVLGIGTPTEVSSFAVFFGLLVGATVYRSVSFEGIWRIFRDSALLSGAVLLVLSTASLLSYGISYAGIPARLVSTLSASGETVFWVATLLGMLVAGTVFEGLAGLIVFAPLLVPIAKNLGIDPLHYGIVLLITVGIGSSAPPLGIGLYIACAAGQARIEDVMWPSAFYTLILLASVVILILFPTLTLSVPHWFGLK